jgi:hypothetical protein
MADTRFRNALASAVRIGDDYFFFRLTMYATRATEIGFGEVGVSRRQSTKIIVLSPAFPLEEVAGGRAIGMPAARCDGILADREPLWRPREADCRFSGSFTTGRSSKLREPSEDLEAVSLLDGFLESTHGSAWTDRLRGHFLPLVLKPDDGIRSRRDLVGARSRKTPPENRHDLFSIEHDSALRKGHGQQAQCQREDEPSRKTTRVALEETETSVLDCRISGVASGVPLIAKTSNAQQLSSPDARSPSGRSAEVFSK